MEIAFTKGSWERYFQYAYTWRFPETPRFIQEAECIVNAGGGTRQNGYDFTTLLLKEKLGVGTRMSFTASFDSYGAPLMMIAEELERDSDGNLRFGNYFEVVLWEQGVNVWDICRNGTDFDIKWLLRDEFPLEPGKPHRLTVELAKERLKIRVNGHSVELHISGLPERAYLGITACEGRNCFYSLEMEPGTL